MLLRLKCSSLNATSVTSLLNLCLGKIILDSSKWNLKFLAGGDFSWREKTTNLFSLFWFQFLASVRSFVLLLLFLFLHDFPHFQLLQVQRCFKTSYGFPRFLSLSLFWTRTDTLFLSLAHTLSHSLSLSCTHTHALMHKQRLPSFHQLLTL